MRKFLFILIFVITLLLGGCAYTQTVSMCPTEWRMDNIHIQVPTGYEFDTLQPFKIELEEEPMIKIYLRKVEQ